MKLNLKNLIYFLILIWPILVSVVALFFHRKQNSQQAWTGGPISWPKSFWLAYTTTTWFLLPVIFLIHPEFPHSLMVFYVFHLFSWWIRGPLELIMIYKWFNWSPRYGISHDLFHVFICTIILALNGGSILNEFSLTNSMLAISDNYRLVSIFFAGVIIFSTLAEILFAVLFLKFRSQQETAENIYFASDDPKWILINRITLTVVVLVMTHLVLQSVYVFMFL